jgi:transcription elongation GreA/GreB family factor
MELKQNLFQQCQAYVNNRLKTVQEIISSNQHALQSETKSSAGDKHETGRAMLQLEMEKASQQLESINQMKTVLDRIDISKSEFSEHKTAHLGSLVFTDKSIYYLSISVGQLIIKDQIYFAISISSPIGKLLLGKSENDIISFNGNKINIQEIH